MSGAAASRWAGLALAVKRRALTASSQRIPLVERPLAATLLRLRALESAYAAANNHRSDRASVEPLGLSGRLGSFCRGDCDTGILKPKAAAAAGSCPCLPRRPAP